MRGSGGWRCGAKRALFAMFCRVIFPPAFVAAAAMQQSARSSPPFSSRPEGIYGGTVRTQARRDAVAAATPSGV